MIKTVLSVADAYPDERWRDKSIYTHEQAKAMIKIG